MSSISNILAAGIAFAILPFDTLLAAAEMETKCFLAREPSWVITAEGQSVLVIDPDPTDNSSQISGMISLFQDSESTLFEITLGQTIKQERFIAPECNERRARLVYWRGNYQVSLILQRTDAATSAMIDNAPAGMNVPQWRLEGAGEDASLDPALAGRMLTYDTVLGIAEAPNTELIAMFDADQAAREALASADSKAREAMLVELSTSDQSRKNRLMQMMKSGELRTGADFYRAAMILQHGDLADDYLLAHHLAVVSLSKGFGDASWLAAASLDRFLLTIGKAQIYGTQWNREGPKGPFIYALPYDSNFISPAEKLDLRVTPVARHSR